MSQESCVDNTCFARRGKVRAPRAFLSVVPQNAGPVKPFDLSGIGDCVVAHERIGSSWFY